MLDDVVTMRDLDERAVRIAEKVGETVTDRDEARARIYREKLLKLPPERAAEIIVDGVERGKQRIRVGNDAVAMDLMTRLAPTLATRLTVPLERKLFGAAGAQ